MKKRRWSQLCACFCAMMLITTTSSAQSEKTKRERTEAIRLIDAWLDSVQAYQHIPAFSAGIVSGDKLIWSRGYGTIDEQHTIPATPKTIYSICSISKLFTSIAVMQQYEAGKLRLDEPVTTYLPWAQLKETGEDSVPITLRGILSHSAGLPRESDFPYWSGPDFPFPTSAQIRDTYSAQAPLFPAERYFQYSNLGLTLAGEVVAKASGTPYPEYAKAHILEPLGLQDTRTFMPMELYGQRLAVGYSALKRDGTRDRLKPFDTKGITPAAGYTSTVEDLAKFASWQFRLLHTGKEDVLKASTLREMQRVQFLDPNWKISYGLGFSVDHKDSNTLVGHEGDCPGYATSLRLRTQDELAVILMKDAPPDALMLTETVFAILDKRKGYEFKEPAPATGIDLEAYAGHYATQPWISEAVMVPWAGGLAYLILPTADPAGNLTLLKPRGGDVFRRVREDGSEAEEIRFQRDGSGKVTGFMHFSNPTPRVAPLEPSTSSQ